MYAHSLVLFEDYITERRKRAKKRSEASIERDSKRLRKLSNEEEYEE